MSSEEAVACAERIAGHHVIPIDYGAIPGCTYCSPQIASIGLTERACKEQGLEYTTGTYQLKAHGKAIAVGKTEGLVKVITSKPYGEILGAHIIGADASELATPGADTPTSADGWSSVPPCPASRASWGEMGGEGCSPGALAASASSVGWILDGFSTGQSWLRR